MKKVFVASVFLGLASMSQATTITATCSPNPNSILGLTGGGNESCSFVGLPNSGVTIISVTYQYIFDFQYDGFSAGTKAADFTFDAPGTSADWAATATDVTRPYRSGATVAFPNGSPSLVADGEKSLFTGSGGFTVAQSFTGASSAVTGGTFSSNFVVDFTADSVATPEPSTYAMIGLGLCALGLFRRKQFTRKCVGSVVR